MNEEILIPCPECGYTGSHTGICRWSLMRTGQVWIFVAKQVEPKKFSFSVWTDDTIERVLDGYRNTDKSKLTEWAKLHYAELLEEAKIRGLEV